MNDIKKQFPIFQNTPGLIYLDSAATTLKPQAMIDKIDGYFSSYSANIHRGVYEISEKASSEFDESRIKIAGFIGAGSEKEVVFTKGATESLNLVARGWGDKFIEEGDEILTTEIEHHSNLIPWQQLALRKGAKLKFIEVDLKTFKLKLDNLEQLIGSKTKILAITQVSNVLGTVNPIKEIVARVRAINPQILVVVDGAQAAAHMPVDVSGMDIDFYAFSGHKLFSPTGIGVLWGKKARLDETDPVNFGGGMISEVTLESATWAQVPDKFEGGTPHIAGVIGLGAAVDFLNEIGIKEVHDQEMELLSYAKDKLSKIEELEIYSAWDSGIVSMNLKGRHAHDVATILDREGIAVRSGHHCAMPLHTKLGQMASFRASFGVYNTTEDIDKLALGIEKAKEVLRY